MIQMTAARQPTTTRRMLNKVPEVTLYFWIIKILATTVGETAADQLATHAGMTLTQLTGVFGGVFAVLLTAQMRSKRYIPWLYWLCIVVISVVGTLITDNLTDKLSVSLTTSTIVFSVILAGCFAAWYATEKTLSIHSITTTRREGFYWLTVLFTFALGTAAGDLFAEKIGLGFPKSALLFAAVIAAVFAAHRKLGLGAIPAFWIAYIVTRPLGASLGDYLSQPKDVGGLDLGTTATSLIFLTAIATVVTFLTITKVDRTPTSAPAE
jgi:uncharacterized membrane-anchored protein